MSLSEKIKKRELQTATMVIDGVRYRIMEKSLLDRGKIQEKISKKKNKSGFAEACWLESCVCSADDGSTMDVSEWLKCGTSFTGKLFSVVAKLNGIADDEIEFEYDPKDSGTIETGS